MSKKEKTYENVYYPVPRAFSLVKLEKPAMNQAVVKRLIQSSVRMAYSLKPKNLYDWNGKWVGPKAAATKEQMETVIHLIESLQPTDAIEVALASQFAITYIRAIESNSEYGAHPLHLDYFEFGHQVLDALQKYRSKGAQQISVQYNVNKGHVGNVINVKEEKPIEAT